MINPLELGVICELDAERFERLWQAMGIAFRRTYLENKEPGKTYKIVARFEEATTPEEGTVAWAGS
jgi:hypothetical protein